MSGRTFDPPAKFLGEQSEGRPSLQRRFRRAATATRWEPERLEQDGRFVIIRREADAIVERTLPTG
jgi:hypothetical protein